MQPARTGAAHSSLLLATNTRTSHDQHRTQTSTPPPPCCPPSSPAPASSHLHCLHACGKVCGGVVVAVVGRGDGVSGRLSWCSPSAHYQAVVVDALFPCPQCVSCFLQQSGSPSVVLVLSSCASVPPQVLPHGSRTPYGVSDLLRVRSTWLYRE